MRVKDLLETIEIHRRNYPDIGDWTIALEQHPEYTSCVNCNKEDDSFTCEDVLFIKSHSMGCCTWNEKRKILGIQIHY